VQVRGVARLWEVARFDFLLPHTYRRSSQMNVEAASYVYPQYYLSPRSIITLQVCVGDVCVGVVWACILMFV